jgi:hypothetical protein
MPPPRLFLRLYTKTRTLALSGLASLRARARARALYPPFHFSALPVKPCGSSQWANRGHSLAD